MTCTVEYRLGPMYGVPYRSADMANRKDSPVGGRFKMSAIEIFGIAFAGAFIGTLFYNVFFRR